MKPTPLERAISNVGSQSELVRRLNDFDPSRPILTQHVTNWKARGVPAERCLAIETATGGAVTRYQLRPDVFGSAAA